MPRLATYSATSWRAWTGTGTQQQSPCANSGYSFPVLIPSVTDGYSLSQLGPAQVGISPWSIDTGYIKYLINGQGKGVFGTGRSGQTTPSMYMLLYDPTGNGNYTYSYFDDCFQPGTPHEMAAIYVDGVLALGGGNEPGAPTGTANSTVRSWQVADGRIVVSMGNTTYGHCVFQYFSYPGESMVRMQMSYTNTTATTHSIKIQRGGDPDWDEYPSYLGRGTPPVPATNTVYSTSTRRSYTISLYTPGNGFVTNTAIPSSWQMYNPNTVLSGQDAGSYGDWSMYSAWNAGNVAPGQTVAVTCFYIVGVGLGNFASYIC